MSLNGKIETSITGNLTADPELRFTPNGVAVASFSVAVTPRVMDTQTNQWRDGNTSFMRCQAWRDMAENVAESLHRGDRVTVTGVLAQHSWEDPETKAKRSAWELTAEDVSASLRYARVRIAKQTKQEAPGGNGKPADSRPVQNEEPPF